VDAGHPESFDTRHPESPPAQPHRGLGAVHEGRPGRMPGRSGPSGRVVKLPTGGRNRSLSDSSRTRRCSRVRGLAAGRLRWAGQHRKARAGRLGDGRCGGHGDLRSVVAEPQRGAGPIPQRIGGPVRLDVDAQPEAAPRTVWSATAVRRVLRGSSCHRGRPGRQPGRTQQPERRVQAALAPCGHEWEADVANRERGSGCRPCPTGSVVSTTAEIQHSPVADNRHPRLHDHHFLVAGTALRFVVWATPRSSMAGSGCGSKTTTAVSDDLRAA
jgi:hypothetical protein